MTAGHRPRATGVHRAVIYERPAQFDEAVTAFARQGIARGEATTVLAVPEHLERVRAALGAGADAVRFADADGIYRRPGQVLSAIAALLDTATAGGRPARLVGEQCLAGLSPAETAHYLRCEAASNALYAAYPVTVLCPYDASALPASVLDACRRTHPELLEGGAPVANAQFVEPRRFLRGPAGPVDPPRGAPVFAFTQVEDLAAARTFLRARATETGLGAAALTELVTGAGEVLTNAVVHGACPCQLWVYAESGALVVHVRDAGSGFADPLAGYLPPEPRTGRGRGLWLAHQTSDAVELATGAAGTDVRLLTTLARAHHAPER